MRYNTPELVEVGQALATVLGGVEFKIDDSLTGGDPSRTDNPGFELN